MEIATIYNDFHRSLLSYIRSKIRIKEDAEDILQNVFVSISSNINKLSDTEKLKSWIHAITRNAIIDYYRKHSKKENRSIDDNMADLLLAEEGDDSTKGLDNCMSTMIDLLPEEYRSIIIDSEIYGIKQKDLAVKYNMAYPSLRSRVQRGRERLKQLYYNCCDIATDTRGNILEARSKNSCSGPCDPCD
jgi:RNA polymerase sigma-70 factor (ECF subfamily)